MRQQPSFISAQNTDSKFIYLVFIVVAFGGLSSSVTRWLSKVPSWLTTFAPADALTMKEEAWNAFPECKSGYQSKICCSGDFLLTASADKSYIGRVFWSCSWSIVCSVIWMERPCLEEVLLSAFDMERRRWLTSEKLRDWFRTFFSK
ncbi:uncharacterized protein LOC121239847 isoform X3 [Juglans microcarpa x Juglans regia]|uniref:uncharacterized protein LOC121239847 isoform X3 n=1 Tax=Juglans microcarpa x Juglans regia TaxID=2249226 RepID=UPI001B7E523B|nr:uncharacterized protein LOC121239847 isoform X3 [Juglans microcarpa x Juglans regia]